MILHAIDKNAISLKIG